MPDLVSILQTGSTNPWIYLPVAILLGALHALEPGHSKSLMAAFIIAIRGTAVQAVILGVSAAVGHTIVVWGLALVGLWLGDKLILDKAEPWLVLISGLMIIALAARLLWSIHAENARSHDEHDHDHDHDEPDAGHRLPHSHHHGGHHHGHDFGGDADAHAAAHAREIEHRFAGRSNVTTGEIVWFGFTGGLLPCPAAIAVLLICLQLKAFALGIAMVGAFSVGLAVTMVSVGLIAAWGTRRAAASWSGFDALAQRLPYLSGGLVLAMGLVVTLRAAWILATAAA
jgi:nickel/cobalt transporter (NicO) family protein